MDGNIVKLVFNAISTGSGWSDVSNKCKELLADSGKLAQGIGSLGSVFGTTGMIAGKAFGMLMQGGIWGFAAEGIKLLIDKLEIFKDRTEEVKKALDDQKKAHEGLLSSITTGYKDAISKIDDEARNRKELIELTKRQTKAQLELKRAQAIMSGDTSTANAVEDELSKADQKNAVDAAEAGVSEAERRVKAARDALAVAQRIVHESDNKVDSARDELRKNAFTPNATVPTVGGPGMIASHVVAQRMGTIYRPDDIAKLNSAYEESDAAAAKYEEARKALDVELQGLKMAKEARKTALLEQEAAEKKTIADREKEAQKAAAQTAKEKAKKEEDERIATEKRQKEIELKNDKEKARLEKEAKEKQFEADRKFEAAQQRKKLEYLRKAADFYREHLRLAQEEVKAAWENYRDPQKIDQAAERRENRQKAIDQKNFERDVERLKKRKDWETAGDLSKRDRATRDLLMAKDREDNANASLRSIDKQVSKIADKIEELLEV